MTTTFGNPRLRSIDGVSLTAAERLHELATPAQVQGRFAQLQEICGRLGVPANAIVVRLEGLERLRDELGYGAPLAALIAGADAITALLRPGDEFGRWNDDALAVLCPGADSEALAQFSAALLAALEQVRVRHALQHDVEITLPIRPSVCIVDELPVADEQLERRLHVA
jgi:GGDEF domain-containing protein